MTIKINLAGVKVGFEPLPPGYYLATISKAEEGVSKAGNPKVVIDWQIVEPEDFVGRKAWSHMTLLEGKTYAFMELLLALGYDEEELNGEVVIEVSDLIGGTCTLVMRETTYNNEPSSEIAKVLPADAYDNV